MPQIKARLIGNARIFDNVAGHEGIKRTLLRFLRSNEPVHILLVGPPGQAKTLFLKSILKGFGSKKSFFADEIRNIKE